MPAQGFPIVLTSQNMITSTVSDMNISNEYLIAISEGLESDKHHIAAVFHLHTHCDICNQDLKSVNKNIATSAFLY